jgi:hypothetical protein
MLREYRDEDEVHHGTTTEVELAGKMLVPITSKCVAARIGSDVTTFRRNFCLHSQKMSSTL